MTRFEKFPIDEHFRVKVIHGEDEKISVDIEREIERIWRPSLTNDRILSLVALQRNSLICKAVDYKHFFAQQTNPQLRQHLQICPVGVTGITTADNCLLVGKRSKDVTQYPHYFEFVPSGSLKAECSDPKKQVLEELHEEARISSDHVKQCLPKFLIHDLETPMIDICFSIEIEKVEPMPNKEYDQILWMTKEEISEHQRQHQWVLPDIALGTLSPNPSQRSKRSFGIL